MKKVFFSFIFAILIAGSLIAQSEVNVTENITSNTTWTSNNVYMLDGLIFVDSLVTLTIEPGTVIKGKEQSNITTGDGASALIVRRGGKLIASGTPESPIIFTSELDDVTLADDLTSEDRGLWGGVILLGRAVTNQPTTANQIEGIPNEPATYARYGGNDDSDNSGILRYISIRHGGFSISGVPGDEINGLTMGAVGNGTTIEYIEVFANLDDGYEWFGGTVNTKYLVAAFCGDDAFDYDQGWRGKNQFWFVIQGTDEAGRGGEHDGGDDNETGTPYAIPMIANATYIGSGKDAAGVGGDGNDRVLYFRDNAGGKYYNSIFTEYVASSSGVTIEDIDGEDSRSRLESGELALENNYWWNIGSSNAIGSVATQDFVQTYLAANNNFIVDPMLRGISREQNNGLDPRVKLNSPAVSGAKQIDDNFIAETSYLGAFNPYKALWTDMWTALYQNGFTGNLNAGTENVVNVTENITSNTTWTSNNVYMLDGLIFVDSLATLTIEAGAVIKGKEQSNITTGDGASALIVRRGGKLIASGTPESPIIFTSEFDDVTIADDLTNEDRGLWGGVILLGRAVTNQPTTANQIEGIPNEPATYARYGGNDDSDNSGILRYISIRHGGFSISGVPGDEINGLTMGAVGSGTTIEYIEVYANLDDGYEWFGGTVNTKYLVAAFCGDDAFDYDQGWRGKNQFWFVIQGTDEAGRGGEHDGGDDNETGTPYAIPMIANATYIGSGKDAAGVGGDGNDRVLYFRDNAGGKYYNSIFTEYVASSSGVTIEDIDGEDSRSRLESGELALENNYWWNIGSSNAIGSVATQDFVQTYLAANNNFIVDPMLRGISRVQDGSLDPRPEVNSPASSGAKTLSDGFFMTTSFNGAFDPNKRLWTEGWSALSLNGFTPLNTVDVEEDRIDGSLPSSFELSQNYPNPFNPTTKIQFSLPKASQVKLVVYNVLGQQIVELVNDFKSAGTYNVDWNASNLSSGIYLYRLEAGNQIITKKMTLLK